MRKTARPESFIFLQYKKGWFVLYKFDIKLLHICRLTLKYLCRLLLSKDFKILNFNEVFVHKRKQSDWYSIEPNTKLKIKR